MKIKPTEETTSESQPAVPPSIQVNYATVYTFWIYDHDRGAAVIYPRMATRETIAKMKATIQVTR